MNIAGYVIEKQIGKGGMAMVYRATQESLGRPVALKVMNPLFADTEEFSERFLDEGRLLASVHHSNIITIHDIGICEGFHFISMEYVEGGELGEKIKEGITPTQAAAYIETLAECLTVAHDLHIVHRDIKPANILFRKDGTLLLTDFGIAKRLTADKGLTTTGVMIGSPHYLSPEQAQGKSVDGRSDIYSLGVLYYEMLTGRRPFTGDSDVAIAIKHVMEPVPELPEVLGARSGIIDRMTRKDPAERFPSCRSLLVALREFRETGAWSGEVADIRLVAPLDSKIVTTDLAAGAKANTTTKANGNSAQDAEDSESRAQAEQAMEKTVALGDTLRLDEMAFHDRDTLVRDASPVVSALQGNPSPTNQADAAPTHGEDSDTSRKRKLFALGLFIVILAAVAANMLYDRTATNPETTVAVPSVPTPTIAAPVVDVDAEAQAQAEAKAQAAEIERQEKDRRAREFLIESLLGDATAAVAAYRLTTPVATSAFTYYNKVLEIEPEHTEAIKGIDGIADTYYRLAKGAEKDWDYDKALRLANTGLNVRPEHQPLRTLLQSLRAEKGKTGRKLKNTFKGPKRWFN